MKQGGTDVSWCRTISFASNGPEGIKNPCQPGLCKAQGNLLCIAPRHFAHLPLPCKPTHHNTPQIQGGLLTRSTEKQNLVCSQSHLYRRHPSAIAKAHCSYSWVHLGRPGHVEEEPSTILSFEKASPPFPGQETQLHTPTHGLRMSLEKLWTARELHPPVPQPDHLWPRPLQWAPRWQPEPLVCPAQVQYLGSPSISQLFFTWPFPFTGIRGGTAVLSVRKGRTIKPAKQHSKRVIPSSAPAWGLSTELLFRNFTKRKSESYFGCMAKKHPPFQRN